jgi:hypothetical protein
LVIVTVSVRTRSSISNYSWRNSQNGFNILTLPNQDDIKDKLRKEVIDPKRGKGFEMISVLDGSSYDLLIKKNETVRTYSFHSPWTYSQKFPNVIEVRSYSEIISTLEKEFTIKFR